MCGGTPFGASFPLLPLQVCFVFFLKVLQRSGKALQLFRGYSGGGPVPGLSDWSVTRDGSAARGSRPRCLRSVFTDCFAFLTSSFCQRVHFLFAFISSPFFFNAKGLQRLRTLWKKKNKKKQDALPRSATSDRYRCKMVPQHFSSFFFFFFSCNLNFGIPKVWDFGMFRRRIILTFDTDVIYLVTFSLGSTSPLTNVLLSSLCLQSLLLFRVSLLISVRSRLLRPLLAHSEDGRRAARLHTCGCKNLHPATRGPRRLMAAIVARCRCSPGVISKVVRSRLHYLLAHCGSQSSCWL